MATTLPSFPPPIGVAWAHLSVAAPCAASDPSGPRSLLAVLLSRLGSCWRRGRACCRRDHPAAPTLTLLHDLTGHLRAGSSTLLISSPGGGASTLLQLLSGRLATSNPSAVVSGGLTWAGLSAAELSARGLSLTRLTAHMPEDDTHEAVLTVRETFEFAASASVLSRLGGSAVSAEAEVERSDSWWRAPRTVRDMLTVLGLDAAADTPLGSAMSRGVSGGERRRVTLGETLLQGARLLALDSPTSGLDAVAALGVCAYLCEWARRSAGTVIVSASALTPEAAACFDEVLLLSEGGVLYHGPRTALEEYLAQRGLIRPPEANLLAFVSTLLAQQEPASTLAQEWRARPIPSAQESPHLAPPDLATLPELSPASRALYAPAPPRSSCARARLQTQREWRLVMRNRALVTARLVSCTIAAIVVGTLFSGALEAPSTFGLLFYSMTFLGFSQNSAVPAAYASRPIAKRHIVSGLYTARSFLLASTAAAAPLSGVAVILFGSIVYWAAGLAPEAARFFVWLLTLLLIDLAIGAFLRMMAYVYVTHDRALAAGGAILGVFVLFGGLFVIVSELPSFLAWVVYLSPFYWGLTVLANNEFRSSRYSQPVGGVAGSPSVGEELVRSYGLMFSLVAQWCGVLFLVVFSAVTIAIVAPTALARIHHEGTRGTKRGGEVAPMVVWGAPPGDAALQSLTLAFARVVCSVPTRVRSDSRWRCWGRSIDKVILRGASGVVRAGSLVALMGPSGSGKTTLLDILAGRKTVGLAGGAFYLPAAAGYCEQSDSHTATDTVEEALAFSVRLRSGQGVDLQDAVTRALRTAELTHARARAVGSLSHGEAKRLTLAVELAAEPRCLYADEPTTAMDARAAMQVVCALRRVADSGRAVVCTLHQPSAAQLRMFDAAILLTPGGRLAYSGPLGERGAQAVAALAGMPGAPPPPLDVDEAPSWLLEALCGVAAAADNEAAPAAAAAAQDWLSAVSHSAALEADAALAAAGLTSLPTPARPRQPVRPLHTQLAAVLPRACARSWRRGDDLAAWLFSQVALALLLGFMYLRVRTGNSFAATQSGLGFCLGASAFATLSLLTTSMASRFAARAVFLRERASGAYAPEVHACSELVSEFPTALATTFLFLCCCFWLAATTRTAAAFFFFWLGNIVLSLFFMAASVVLAALLPTQAVGQIVAGLMVSTSILFAGLFIRVVAMPVFWKGLYYAVPTSHVLRALATSQFYCSGDGCPSIAVLTPDGAAVEVGRYKYVSQYVGSSFQDRWAELGWAALSAGVLAVIAVASVRFVDHTRR